MSSNKRNLRSSTPDVRPSIIPSNVVSTSSITLCSASSSAEHVDWVAPGSKLPGLSVSELKLLRQKQHKLSTTATSTLASLSPSSPHLINALSSTLIFAQHEAGTAVCVGPAGWVLTCAHCFGDNEEEYRAANKRRWLLFYTGIAVQAECRVWNPKCDLALLKIVALESDVGKEGDVPSISFVHLATDAPAAKTPIICVGQPGRDDLESDTTRRTKYNLVEVSEGRIRGMVKGADPHDNSEIGSLMHDAWTYWGHSGAPFLRERDGALVGLHSSWDEETGVRHGVPLVAIKAFLKDLGMRVVGDSGMEVSMDVHGLLQSNERRVTTIP